MNSCSEVDESANASAILYVNDKRSETIKATEKMLDSVESFSSSLMRLNLKQSDTDLIFKLCVELFADLKETNLKFIEDDNGMSAQQIVEVTNDLVCKKLHQTNSAFKRSKIIETNDFYVSPKEVAIGTRFELKKHKNRKMKIPKLIQSHYEYVSILETIQSLFKCVDFRDMYFEHNNNLQREHICQPGKYKYACCGSTFKKNELFSRHPQSLQLQVAYDDFEVCNPLASKANRHKVCAVYFTIQNLPKQFLSKLNNIYLICLCNSDDVKMKHTDFNNIWQLILNEIKILETTGISIDAQTILKGTIMQLSFDNLGANVALGFVGSFSSNYYCRHCECTSSECQVLSRENSSKRRTKENYYKQIEIVNESVKVKFEETKGVKYYCKLSDLKFFHVIDNPTADIMHDVCEGAIPFALKRLFHFCFESKIFTSEELNLMIQFFDYGFLNNRNIPSDVNLDKRSLGQNATQSLCLFRHVPFILFKFRDHSKLKPIWEVIESLLRVVEIIYSEEITESDLNILNDMIHIHLEGIKKLGVNLIPKLHFMLHYASIIRSLGPLVAMNMMRYESKHKFFKDVAKNTRNYKNINKTLALKHQNSLCTNGFTYKDSIENGKLVLLDNNFISKYKIILNDEFGGETINVSETRWLRINNYHYRKDLLIIYDAFLHQIQNVLVFQNRYYFLCKRFDTVSYNRFLNSFKIEENSIEILIELCKLQNTKSFELKLIGSENYVIASTLELRSKLCLLN